MKVLLSLFVLSIFAISTTFALPTTQRSSSSPQNGEPSDCLKECINGVLQYGQELSILKNPDFSKYFNKLNEICEVLQTAKTCVKNCGEAVSNPFELESLNYVCQSSDGMEKIAVIKQCLKYIDHNIDETCTKECQSNNVIDETDVSPPPKKMEENPQINQAISDCSNFKCMARCNVEIVGKECGKNLGREFQNLLQQVLDIQRKDLEKLNLVEAMAKTAPSECNYLYDPKILFGNNKPTTTENEAAAANTPDNNPDEDAKTLYTQAQLQLLLKQIDLTEKQDQLIDRENAKIDMEMSYMEHKAQQRDERFFQNHPQQAAAAAGIPIFMPMEKMPKELVMGMPHSEQQQQQPPMHMIMESMPEEEPQHYQPEGMMESEQQHPHQMQMHEGGEGEPQHSEHSMEAAAGSGHGEERRQHDQPEAMEEPEHPQMHEEDQHAQQQHDQPMEPEHSHQMHEEPQHDLPMEPEHEHEQQEEPMQQKEDESNMHKNMQMSSPKDSMIISIEPIPTMMEGGGQSGGGFPMESAAIPFGLFPGMPMDGMPRFF